MSGSELKRRFDEAIARLDAMSDEEFRQKLRERCPELLEGRGPRPVGAVVPRPIRLGPPRKKAAKPRPAAPKRSKRAGTARKPAAKVGRRRRGRAG